MIPWFRQHKQLNWWPKSALRPSSNSCNSSKLLNSKNSSKGSSNSSSSCHKIQLNSLGARWHRSRSTSLAASRSVDP